MERVHLRAMCKALFHVQDERRRHSLVEPQKDHTLAPWSAVNVDSVLAPALIRLHGDHARHGTNNLVRTSARPAARLIALALLIC